MGTPALCVINAMLSTTETLMAAAKLAPALGLKLKSHTTTTRS